MQPYHPSLEQKPLPGIRHVLVVASGKGGVGKSSVAVNLAVALAKNHKVGLLDADIHGPSLPRMMGVLGQRPIASDDGRIQPLVRFGVKIMSIGLMVEDSTSIVWRGPMLFKAIDQFLYDVDWGDLDYLVIDLPPGTGDVQLTLAQRIPITGALIVSTPQNISLVDAKKAIDMFDRLHVPILGVIENMSYLVNPVNQEKMQLYPKGELDQYLQDKEIIKIGELPFNPHIALSCEIGVPVLSQAIKDNTTREVQEFFDICEHIEDLLSETPALTDRAPTASALAEKSGSCGSGSCGCSSNNLNQ